jgi:hypothetical protein
MKVLLVDDSRTMRNIQKKVLEALGKSNFPKRATALKRSRSSKEIRPVLG